MEWAGGGAVVAAASGRNKTKCHKVSDLVTNMFILVICYKTIIIEYIMNADGRAQNLASIIYSLPTPT